MIGVRQAPAILTPWVPAAPVAATCTLRQERLPAELPTHWDFGGPADAATSAPVFFGWRRQRS